MVLGKLPVPGRPTIWIRVGHAPTALTVGAGGGCLDSFTNDGVFLCCPFSHEVSWMRKKDSTKRHHHRHHKRQPGE